MSSKEQEIRIKNIEFEAWKCKQKFDKYEKISELLVKKADTCKCGDLCKRKKKHEPVYGC